MKLDTLVAGGSGVVYAGAAAFAAFGTNFLPPFAAIVGVKDGLIALLCFVWMVAEYRGGAVRARGLALAVALVFLVDALLGLVGGAGPWRADIAVNPSLTGGLISGVAFVLLSLALLKFVLRPDDK